MTEDQNSGRKRYSPEEKFKIVKEQLTTKTSVSEICKKYGISPGNFYNWQEIFFCWRHGWV
ncbi:MAG: transposase [Bdellovibrionia bacterium]